VGAVISAALVGVSWGCVLLCLFTYYLRVFFITAGYHRYFSHRSFRTSRAFQFVLAFMGCTAAQKGPLWWAGHHRGHHLYSDTPRDPHSPVQRGFLWAHVGWVLSPRFDAAPIERIRDFARYPELRWLDRNYLVPPLLALFVLWLLGGVEAAVWGGLVSTVFLWHGTFSINSLAHLWGSRRYATSDASRNNFFLALLTMGEGWHNNHHHYPASASQGFFWWEVDLTYAVLRPLSWVGVVWDLKRPPRQVLEVRAARAGGLRNAA
jgi:stearoyl-CoA desaturase (delta-9 desaturase)